MGKQEVLVGRAMYTDVARGEAMVETEGSPGHRAPEDREGPGLPHHRAPGVHSHSGGR